ncbi:hypothetical protein SOVF_010270 isoform B, partial [Spinacia oleracea]
YNFGVRQISSATLNYHSDLHHQAQNQMRRMLRVGAPISFATVIKFAATLEDLKLWVMNVVPVTVPHQAPYQLYLNEI